MLHINYLFNVRRQGGTAANCIFYNKKVRRNFNVVLIIDLNPFLYFASIVNYSLKLSFHIHF